MSTETNIKHAPTPWGHDGYSINDANNRVLFRWDTATTIAEDDANSAFLVRAVNSHEPLLKALNDALMLLEHGDFRNGNTDPSGSIDEGEVLTASMQRRLREVLKLARGDA